MDDWLDRLALALGERAPSAHEIGSMLRLSREVAHGVERKYAPLFAYVAGMHVARRTDESATAESALAEVEAIVRSLLPAVSPDRAPGEH